MSTSFLASPWWFLRTRYFCVLLIVAFLSACGGGGSSDPDVIAPSDLTYTAATVVYTVGVAITANTPTSSGGDVTLYSISPALPAGLSLNADTGVISGTPTGAVVTATYTVTASNSSGETTVTLSITVNAVAIPTMTLNSSTATMDPESQRVFTASVTEFDDKSVTWSTLPAETGTLSILDDFSVAYTAPAAGGEVQLIATSVADPAVTATVTITVSATPALTETIFNNGNIGGVSSGPTSPTTFTIDVSRHIVYFDNYHYFNGGVLPGLLSLRHSDGTVYGPWQTTGGVGQGGVQNASWICYPDVTIKAGTYTIIDSNPATWSYNAESLGQGFSHLKALTITGDLSWENVITRTGDFSFGIKSDGTLWAWGANSDGQLGIGDTTLRRVPVKVDNSSWKAVAIGTNGSNSKPFILAVKTDGTLWGWGDNQFGQLGNGTTTSSNVPVQIGSDTNWTAVAAAYSTFSVALKSNGTYWHWGLLSYSGASNSQVPVQFGTDTDWSKVAAGAHVMAIKTNGTLWGWGYNGNAQVGNATTVGPVTTPYQIQPGQTWLDVSVNASSSHALRSDHTLWSWGFQGYGSLGQGIDQGYGNVTSPGQIGTDSNWASVSSGEYSTMAIKTNGSLWGWGWNLSSSIGDGTETKRVSPVPIGIATDWASVAVSTFHGLGLTTNGTLWGWGDNDNGQLGDTLQANSTIPRLITP